MVVMVRVIEGKREGGGVEGKISICVFMVFLFSIFI